MFSKENLKNKAAELGVDLTDHQLHQFEIYYSLLIEKNKVMNLTAVTEPDEVIDKHFTDSLSIVKALPFGEKMRVIDVGTGAGFPGIPLKIAFPKLQITLLDSLAKRVRFLQEVIDALQFQDVEAVHFRAEEAARNKKYRECYDLCVSRAVANLSVLLEYCLPFVRVGGCFAAYKAGDVLQETENAEHALSVLGGSLGEQDIVSFELPGTDYSRTILRIHKDKATPHRYPRKAGVPKREPL